MRRRTIERSLDACPHSPFWEIPIVRADWFEEGASSALVPLDLAKSAAASESLNEAHQNQQTTARASFDHITHSAVAPQLVYLS